MKNNYFNREYFKSRIFKRLFSSYIIMIVSLFVFYTAAIVFETTNISRERQKQYYDLKVKDIGNVLDMQFLEANIIISSINSSDSIAQFASAAVKESKVSRDYRDSDISAYQVITDIKNYTVSGYNLNIYDTVLFVDGLGTAYSSIQTYPLEGIFDKSVQADTGLLNVSTLNSLFWLKNSTTVFNKEWIIYSGLYDSVLSRGKVCVLFDKSRIAETIKEVTGNESGISFNLAGNQIYSNGDIKDQVTFEKKSAINADITYTISVNRENLKLSGTIYMIVAISSAVILCVVFIILSLFFAIKYYKPLDSIEKIINDQLPGGDTDNEMDKIISGIENLIGERNGYREKMVSIRPYVQSGMMHGMLNGNLEPEKLDVLFKEEYMVLQKPYFLLSVFNIAYVGNDVCDKAKCKKIRAIIEDAAKEYSGEDTNIALLGKDLFNTFVIINSNVGEGLDKIYYDLYERIVKRIDNSDYVITVGVDELREDISQLSEACANALRTLGSMLVGGRGAVYFYEKEMRAGKQKYFFPKDALSRVTKALKDGSLADIRDFLDEVLEVNTTKYDADFDTVQLLIDEVHITTIKALKNVDVLNMIDFNIEKLNTVATLEEVFDYYYAIYETISGKMTELATPKKDIGALDKSILECIDEEFRNQEMSLQYLTEKFGVSNKYISLVFKKYIGRTYLEYLQEKRIEYAISLMQTTDYSLEQISKMSGYTNLLTFRRNFKTVKGINPSEFLEK